MKTTIINAVDRWMVITYDFDGYISKKGYDGLARHVQQSINQWVARDPALGSICAAVEAYCISDDDLVDWLATKGVERTNLELVSTAVRTFAMYLVEKDP